MTIKQVEFATTRDAVQAAFDQIGDLQDEIIRRADETQALRLTLGMLIGLLSRSGVMNTAQWHRTLEHFEVEPTGSPELQARMHAVVMMMREFGQAPDENPTLEVLPLPCAAE